MSDRRLMRSLRTAFGVRRSPLRRGAGWLDENLGGGSSLLRDELRHIFPDSWAFFLGEIALYCFILLVVTGIYLALFFHASQAEVVYHGSYQPLVGVPMSDAYSSVLDLSLDVRAGLLVRQVHHWAALVFVGALMIHLLRMLFTGAYRRPRRINWVVGLSLLFLVGFNGLMGYSLPDDLLSGTGLRVAYSITESIPFLGPTMASLMFGGQFPTSGIIARIYPVHIFLLPAGIAGLLGLHLGMLWLQRHTEFPGPGRDDRTIVGTPMVPAYALRTTGYLHAGRRRPHRLRRLCCRSTPCGCTGRTRPGIPRRRRSPTGTWAGSRAPCGCSPAGTSRSAASSCPPSSGRRSSCPGSSSRRCSCGPGSTAWRCTTTGSTTCSPCRRSVPAGPRSAPGS